MGSELTIGGWIFMLGSCGGVLFLVVWCYRRLLSTPRGEDEEPKIPPGLGP